MVVYHTNQYPYSSTNTVGGLSPSHATATNSTTNTMIRITLSVLLSRFPLSIHAPNFCCSNLLQRANGHLQQLHHEFLLLCSSLPKWAITPGSVHNFPGFNEGLPHLHLTQATQNSHNVHTSLHSGLCAMIPAHYQCSDLLASYLQ